MCVSVSGQVRGLLILSVRSCCTKSKHATLEIGVYIGTAMGLCLKAEGLKPRYAPCLDRALLKISNLAFDSNENLMATKCAPFLWPISVKKRLVVVGVM